MSISPARRVAFTLLLQVEREDAYAVELLNGSQMEPLSTQDCALATELVMGTLRWQGALDAAITRHVSKPLAKLDAEVLTSLRLGAYQLLHLDRIPAHAAVNDSVELVRRARKTSAAPMTNAILRKIASLKSQAASYGAEAAYPAWLVARWREQYGEAAAARICDYGQHAPETALRLVSPEVEQELASDGVQLAPGRIVHSARRVAGGELRAAKAFREHRAMAQDEGSQLVALLAGKAGSFLDCCAAPGGKMALIAERNPQARIVALELHEHRARLLRERVPHSNVEVRTGDATLLESTAEFACVLADVPCSGTGTLARNPEIRWKLKPADLADLQQRQRAILRAAMGQVAPGGRLVYSTCSLEPEECEAVVRAELTPEFMLLPCVEELRRLHEEGELIAEPEPLVSGDFLRTLPGAQPCEGFFAAVLLKRSR